MSHDIDTLHFLSGQPYPLSARAEGGIYKFNDYRENPDTVEALFEYGTGDKRFLGSYGCCLINGSGTGYRIQGTKGTLEFEKSPLWDESPWEGFRRWCPLRGGRQARRAHSARARIHGK